jgi:hypothetical protein
LSNSLISIDSCVDKYLDLFEVSKWVLEKNSQ